MFATSQRRAWSIPTYSDDDDNLLVVRLFSQTPTNIECCFRSGMEFNKQFPLPARLSSTRASADIGNYNFIIVRDTISPFIYLHRRRSARGLGRWNGKLFKLFNQTFTLIFNPVPGPSPSALSSLIFHIIYAEKEFSSLTETFFFSFFVSLLFSMTKRSKTSKIKLVWSTKKGFIGVHLAALVRALKDLQSYFDNLCGKNIFSSISRPGNQLLADSEFMIASVVRLEPLEVSQFSEWVFLEKATPPESGKCHRRGKVKAKDSISPRFWLRNYVQSDAKRPYENDHYRRNVKLVSR